jgi:hypothetical protein
MRRRAHARVLWECCCAHERARCLPPACAAPGRPDAELYAANVRKMMASAGNFPMYELEWEVSLMPAAPTSAFLLHPPPYMRPSAHTQ